MNKKEKDIIARFKKTGARVETSARVRLKKKQDLSLYYTPGVGVASRYLAEKPKETRNLSVKKNSVAVISDGSAVLGLGNIGPYGALPVMEGKALIFKEFADIDAWPIVLDTQDTEEIIRTIIAIAPAWGGINLEDIAAPQCFEIERRVNEALDIPVMHDDQHGTAIVVLAGLINAAKVVKKDLKKMRIVISGAGAAATAVGKLLIAYGVKDIIFLDRSGIVYTGRKEHMNVYKEELGRISNPKQRKGGFDEAMAGSDAFIGLSGKGLLMESHVRSMNTNAIIFALANPDPEIFPDAAKRAGATVVATGRSDFPNQINNALVFPGVFRGALDRGVKEITVTMKLNAARALASLIARPTVGKIVPDVFDTRVVKAVSASIR